MSNMEAAWLVVTLSYALFPASHSNNFPLSSVLLLFCKELYFSAHRLSVICCRNQASKQAHNTAKVHYLTVCSVVQWSWAALPSIKVNRVIRGFTVHVKLFGHSVPNKNDTDVEIFSGHQTVLFSKSPDVSQLFFMDKEDVHVGGGREPNRKAYLPPFDL